jgi:hypothetical protein
METPRYLNGKEPASHTKICLYCCSSSLAFPEQNNSLLWKLISIPIIVQRYTELISYLMPFGDHAP